MRTLTLLAGLCLGASAWANLPANEPVEPIAPAEITDPAKVCLLYTSPSPRDLSTSRMPSSA